METSRKQLKNNLFAIMQQSTNAEDSETKRVFPFVWTEELSKFGKWCSRLWTEVFSKCVFSCCEISTDSYHALKKEIRSNGKRASRRLQIQRSRFWTEYRHDSNVGSNIMLHDTKCRSESLIKNKCYKQKNCSLGNKHCEEHKIIHI